MDSKTSFYYVFLQPVFSAFETKDMLPFLIRKKLFHLIFPRGRQYEHNPDSDQNFTKVYTKKRKICLFYTKQHHLPESKGVVILVHPYVKSAKLFFYQKHVDLYQSLGYDVVIFDFNGFGQSPFLDFNFHKDLEEVSLWVKNEFNTNNVICHGISFGAAQTIRAAHSGKLQASAIIIENCLDKSIHYFKVRNKKIYYFIKTLHFLSPSLKKHGDYTHVLSEVMEDLKVAFIYCTEDDLTTIKMGNLLMAQCKLPYYSLTCAGKHLKAIDDTKKYESFLVQFL